MPTLALTYSSETPSGDNYLGVLTDSTTYTSPARNTGAVYLTGVKMDAESEEGDDITIASYTPASATTFTFTIVTDGWIRFRYCWIPNYDNAVTYSRYDAVYYNGSVYRAILNSFSGQLPTNNSYWEVISEPTSLVDNDGTSTESANISVLVYDLIVYPFAKKLYGDLAEDYAIKALGTFADLEEFRAYKEIGAIVAALAASNTRERYVSGERIARYAAQLSS